MPKFKRLPKKAKPFKFELEEAFTITPRFDREFWIDHKHTYIDGLYYIQHTGIGFLKGGRNNGLTCHRDHSWALTAAHCHDVLLSEGYAAVDMSKEKRAAVDRVFLSVLLDHVDTLTGFKKVLYKSFAYAMYWAVRANSNVKHLLDSIKG